ncbi:hypothetical protein MCG98_00640 [Ruminococcus sp. OA3]|uniref:hypothetical protein n=1 Tax=Ruminococcus sp. OA3 TaxID=2914164 RepID=UPI001F062BD6|nr:hypothetical protein [Ruminococcus sp. OA3]MCH1981081.1 hypothetical protein [Ruminococcus sp. OA3]
MKKRMLAILTAGTMCMAMPLTAFAEEATTTQELTATLTADPAYTVTIPGTVSMGNDGTAVDVTAEGVENLPEGKKISVTIAGTQAYRNQMVLECNAADSPTGMNTSIRYQIIPESGEVIETTGDKDQANGKEVAAFTGNETKQYTITPVIAGRYEYDVAYSGNITFGISLADM